MTASAQDVAAPASASLRLHGTAPRDAEHHGRLGDVLVFVVPLLLAVELKVGGRLYLSEVVLLLALPFLLAEARRRGVSRISHVVLALGVLWFFGLFLTDVYRVTPFADYSRGWSKVAFVLVSFAALSVLIDRRWHRVTLFAAGLALGEALQFFLHPNVFAAEYPWKFGLGGPVTLAGVILASRPAVSRRPIVATAILVGLGVVNLRLGFRSLGGVCLLTAVLVVLAARSAQLVRLDRRALRTLTMLAASVVAGFSVVEAYERAAQDGLLGERAQRKYQAERGNLGTLVGGRPEIIVASRAIRDSPIVGHGSWAKDPKYAAALRDELFRAGYRAPRGPPSSDLIPTHSYLFGAWVEAGILGAIFWLWAVALVISILPRLHRLPYGRVALVAFLAVSFLWDVLFSPFGAEARLVAPFSLVVFLLARNELSAAAKPQEAR